MGNDELKGEKIVNMKILFLCFFDEGSIKIWSEITFLHRWEFSSPPPRQGFVPRDSQSAQLHMAAGRKATAAPYCLITCNNLDFYLRAPF